MHLFESCWLLTAAAPPWGPTWHPENLLLLILEPTTINLLTSLQRGPHPEPPLRRAARLPRYPAARLLSVRPPTHAVRPPLPGWWPRLPCRRPGRQRKLLHPPPAGGRLPACPPLPACRERKGHLDKVPWIFHIKILPPAAGSHASWTKPLTTKRHLTGWPGHRSRPRCRRARGPLRRPPRR